MLKALADILFPEVCLLCGSGSLDGGLCAACGSALDAMSIRPPMCTLCGEPFPSSSGPDHACGSCLSDKPPFSAARSALVYDGAALEAVHRLKYAGDVNLAAVLGPYAASAAALMPVPHAVVPVPLHPARLKERGFNQSLLLAREVAKALRASLDIDGLARVRQTPQQTTLTAAERRKNVAGAFRVARPGSFKGRQVLLVDDVYTTGSTIRECAKALRDDGAGVLALTLARALRV